MLYAKAKLYSDLIVWPNSVDNNVDNKVDSEY